jgi:hypothetical protein
MRALVTAVVLLGVSGCGGHSDAGTAMPRAGAGAAAISSAGREPDATPPPTAAGGGGEAGRAPAAMDAGALDAGIPADASTPHDSGAPADAGMPSCQRCAAYAPAVQLGTVEPAELDSLSGLAASRKHPGIVFAHNDHDRPIVFALDLQGHAHARIALSGVSASDLEDLAVGPCASDSCVYLGDIGDNAVQRSEYGILRFVEPQIPDAPGATDITLQAESFRFRYEDGSHNAESLLVAPSGALYLITKLAPGTGGAVAATGPSTVYRLSASALVSGTVALATKVTNLTLPKNGERALSAAAAHPCGLGFLVRTYDRVYEYLVPNGADFEAAFSAMPVTLAAPDEPQSEGIDYASDGRGFITSGEGAHAPIFQTGCLP